MNALRYQPAPGDDVERWIEHYRDAHAELGYDTVREVVDALLAEYRLHADAGTSLDEDIPERGTWTSELQRLRLMEQRALAQELDPTAPTAFVENARYIRTGEVDSEIR